jgi:hypothetical protein
MTNIRRALEAAAAGGDDALYVEDLFSTYLYEGNDGVQTIANGIDLDGEGGMVWQKRRPSSENHTVSDSARGISGSNYKRLCTNNTSAENTSDSPISSFNSNGFSMNRTGEANSTGETYVSWSFRKAENFFTQLQFTADDSFMSPAHGLGSKPGMVIYKCTTSNTDASDGHWWIWVEGMANNKTVNLDTNEVLTGIGYIGDTDATTSTFYTTSGQTYVAYYFGNDQAVFGADSDESIIKCGTYEGTAADNAVSLGWEPQYVLIKNVDNTDDWIVFDMMRGVATGGDDAYLKPNKAEGENAADYITFGPTGFTVHTGYGIINESGSTYIYMAIRRPMKTPSAGTEVFAAYRGNGASDPGYISGFAVDMGIRNYTTGTTTMPRMQARLTGGGRSVTSTTAAEIADSNADFDNNNGWFVPNVDSNNYSPMFKRATGFMDVVAYTGSNGANITHGLGVVPEMLIVKSRTSGSYDWHTYHKAMGNNYELRLNQANGTNVIGTTTIWNTTTPTASVFSVLNNAAVNGNATENYIAYLFATVAGVSKVGSYTGTAASLDLNMGFAAGARFFLTKRTDATGDWYQYDSAQGIVAGNAPYFLLNGNNVAQVTTTDYVDPLAAGITLTASGSSTINVSGGTYIFLAIA